MAPPVVTLAGPVFTALRSACGVRVSVSVAVLLPGVGSVVPTGAVTLAVLLRLPVAEAEMLAVTVYVAIPPFARLTVVLMLPVPLVTPQLAAGVHVQVALLMPAGSVSVTVAPVTASGPPFVTVMVYVTVPPGTAVVAPSVLVMLRSACGVSVSVSVAVLLPGVGSVVPAGAVTLAVLLRLPVAEAEMLAVTVNVAVPPFARLTVVLMLPVPLVAPQLAAGAHVQLALLMPAGSASVTVAPVTALGPALLTTMVYVTVPPGTAVVTPSVFVMLRSACGVRVSVSVVMLLPGVGSVVPAG